MTFIDTIKELSSQSLKTENSKNNESENLNFYFNNCDNLNENTNSKNNIKSHYNKELIELISKNINFNKELQNLAHYAFNNENKILQIIIQERLIDQITQSNVNRFKRLLELI